MSSFDENIQEFNGFVKGYWAKRQYYSYNTHVSPECKPFARYIGRHKRSGATYGCSLKQFDIKRARIFRKFSSRKSIYFGSSPTVWWFGKSLNKKLGFNTKFKY